MAMDDKGGMAGYSAAVPKKKKNKKAAAGKKSTKFAGNAERIDAMLKDKKAKGVSKATYKAGGLYSSGRAIAQAPRGTKVSKSASTGRKGSPANKNTNKSYRY